MSTYSYVDTYRSHLSPFRGLNRTLTEVQTQESYGAQFNSFWYASYNAGQLGSALGQLPLAYFTGNPYTVTDTDYGTGAPGGTLRTTTTLYEAFGTGNQCAGNYCTANLLNLRQSVAITGSGNSATTNYYYDAQGGIKGSLTSIQRLLNGGYITTDTMTYYSTGMLYTKADALGNTTTYVYDSSNLYPSTITNALNQTTTYNYDDDTGVLNSEKDPNGNTTSYQYDEMNRITGANFPDGGSVGYSYNDSTPTPSVTVTQAITSTQQFSETEIVDGLGRLIHTQLTSDPEGTDYVDTSYDALGRKASVSNPYRSTSDPTYGVTYYNYDALNRLTSQVQPDGSGSTITYSYSGNTTTVTDEAGKSRKSQVDGLSRLSNVWEDPSGVDYLTTYSYDCLSNLRSVVQNGSHNRTFQYDSLSRLTQAVNPENGTLSYGYDNTGTLINKTDGRNITITYNRDGLHRLTSKNYSDSEPTLSYCYDNQQTACGTPSVSNGIGRRTGMKDASGTTSWSYDTMGRPVNIASWVGNISTGTQYFYNLDGSLNWMYYPDSNDIDFAYSGAGRAITATYDNFGEAFNYAANVTYTASGLPTGYKNEGLTGNVVATVANSYNKRLQPVTLSATNSQSTILSLTYNFNLGSGDNANVAGITNNLNSARSQAYSYDSLNRLLTASFYGGADQYGYDTWGNLLSKTVTAGSGDSWSNAVDGDNHLTPAQGYDGAGNFTSVDGVQYNYFNAENQWTRQSSFNVSYLYDGDGKRVQASGGASGTRIYAYDAAGRVIEEMDQNGNVLNEYMYLGDRRVARVYKLYSGTYYYYGDQLGSARVMADSNGNPCYDADFHPWGEEQVFLSSCPQDYKFTGKERDPDMSIDDFGARFYKSSMARFYSPDWSADPEPVPYAKLENPQTLNLYTYVANNPTTLRDPTGHILEKNDDGESAEGQGIFGKWLDSKQAEDREALNEKAQQQEQKTEVGYGETAGLVPERAANADPKKKSPYDSSTWDPNSTQQLQDGRTNIMDISDRNSNVKKATASDNPIEQQAWNANADAAKNSKGSTPGKYFFIRQEGVGAQHPSKRAGYGQGTPIKSYGPFRNVGGGDVPRGNSTFIDIYDK